MIIGEEWKSRAEELAAWSMEHLVNRRDVWGQYIPLNQRKMTPNGRVMNALTLPAKDMRGRDMVTLEKLTRHYRALQVGHVIGLHAASAENTSRWIAVDVDLHDPGAEDAAEIASRNYSAAIAWWHKLRGMGLDPLLFDSNGAGGYHLWVIFDQPYPTHEVHAFGLDLVSDHEMRRFSQRPEVFPKSAITTLEKPGSWLRLPGRHHTRDHFTRLWSGDEWLDSPWLDGSSAIDAIMATRLVPLPRRALTDGAGGLAAPVVAKTMRDVSPKKRKKGPDPNAVSTRATVCVDLDGVLAHYDGWKGVEHIGDPLPGAADFMQDLSEFCDVLVFTTRCNANDRSGAGGGDEPQSVAALQERVTGWLQRHGIKYHSVYVGQGKPFANAFVDDRAVSCQVQQARPGGERAVFAAALEQARALCAARSTKHNRVSRTDPDLADVIDGWKRLPHALRDEIAQRVRDALVTRA